MSRFAAARFRFIDAFRFFVAAVFLPVGFVVSVLLAASFLDPDFSVAVFVAAVFLDAVFFDAVFLDAVFFDEVLFDVVFLDAAFFAVDLLEARLDLDLSLARFPAPDVCEAGSSADADRSAERWPRSSAEGGVIFSPPARF